MSREQERQTDRLVPTTKLVAAKTQRLATPRRRSGGVPIRPEEIPTPDLFTKP